MVHRLEVVLVAMKRHLLRHRISGEQVACPRALARLEEAVTALEDLGGGGDGPGDNDWRARITGERVPCAGRRQGFGGPPDGGDPGGGPGGNQGDFVFDDPHDGPSRDAIYQTQSGVVIRRHEADSFDFPKFDGSGSFRDKWSEARRTIQHQSGRPEESALW